MKCSKCGNDLGIESNGAEKGKYCSSCEKHDFPKSNSIEEVLRWIVQNRGVEVFQNSSVINAILSDLAPKDEKGRIKIKNALAVGAGEYFHGIVQRGILNDVSRKQFLSRLSSDGFTTEFCNFIFDVFAYSINQSVAVQEQETSKTSANDTHKNIITNTQQNSKKVSHNIKSDARRDKEEEIVKGELISNGKLYEGVFLKEDKTGKGKMTSAIGIIYEGEFLEGYLNGKGKMTYPNGAVYEGKFQKGQKTGKGKLIFSSGKIYEGQLLNICPNGKGKMIWPDGRVYEGDFVNGNREGRGRETTKKGTVYEGDWLSDEANGKGKYIWPDGSVYEGDFVNGNSEGKGKQIWSDGRVYEGDWLQDKRTGKGKFTWPDVGNYEGDWLDGKMTGKGKFTFASGNIYEGDFTDNQYNGKGKFISLDGEIYEGFYQNNKRQGTGILIKGDGKCYSQIYSQDKLLESRELGFRNRSEVCPCGSGKMYKNCHERRL